MRLFTSARMCAAQEALEQELRDEAAKGQLQLDDATREEYNRIKRDAGAKTSKLAQDLASLQTTQKVRDPHGVVTRGMLDLCAGRRQVVSYSVPAKMYVLPSAAGAYVTDMSESVVCRTVMQAEMEAMQTHVDATKGITERMASLGEHTYRSGTLCFD